MENENIRMKLTGLYPKTLLEINLGEFKRLLISAYNRISSYFFQMNRPVWSVWSITLLDTRIRRHLDAHIFAFTLCYQMYYQLFIFLLGLKFDVLVWVLIYWRIKCVWIILRLCTTGAKLFAYLWLYNCVYRHSWESSCYFWQLWESAFNLWLFLYLWSLGWGSLVICVMRVR